MTTELAKLCNGELVYGVHGEVEQYAQEQNTAVERYFNYIAPSTVQKAFKYIGKAMCDPNSIPRPIYQRDEAGVYIGIKQFKEKF